MKLHGLLSVLIICFATLPLTAQDTATEPRVDFATYFGSNSQTTIEASAIDRDGNLYITGTTSAPDFPVTAGAFRETPKETCTNGSCVFFTSFVAKFSRDGRALVYSTFINEGSPIDIAVDANGNAYVTGLVVDLDYTGTPGAWRTKCMNSNSAQPNQMCKWIVKLNANGSSLIYSTLVEDVGECDSIRIAVNSAGEVYVAGDTSISFTPPCPTTPGVYRRTVTGSGLGTMVMKFNASGSRLLFSTWVSSASPRDQFRALAVTPNDHLVIVGTALNSNFPTTSGAFQRVGKGSTDVYVAKLGSDGSTVLASTLIGGALNDEATSVAVDSALNVYVTGITGSADFPTTPGAYRRILDSGNCSFQPGAFQQCTDVFVAKLPPDFSRLTFSTLLGGSGDDFAPYLAIDKVGHVYLTGLARENHPLVKPVQSQFRPLYVTKLNTSGSGLLFSSYFGGTLGFQGLQQPRGIEVDNAGNAYIAWITNSTDVPTTANAYQSSNPGGGMAGLIAKFDIPPCSLGSAVPSVTICTPISGVRTSSPVLIAAGATDNRAIAGMVIYVDGVKKFTISNASHFDTRVSMGVGMHHLTVKAWDADGRVFSNARMITVQ